MADWRHRAKVVALLAVLAVLTALVVDRDPEVASAGVFGPNVFGVLAVLVGLARLFVTGASGD